MARSRTRKWRYVVPVALVGLLWAGYSVRDRLEARAAPTLPARTPAEVADWAASPHPEPRSGFLEMSTNLGLGNFGTTSGDSGGSLVGLAAGSNDARLWEDGSQRRIALLQELEELCDATAVLDKGKLVAASSMEMCTASSDSWRAAIA